MSSSSPQNISVPSPSPSRSIRIDLAQPHPSRSGSDDRDGALPPHPRRSPTLVRSADPNDPSVQERQRSLDVDSAMQLSRARSGSVAVSSYPAPPLSPTSNIPLPRSATPERLPPDDPAALVHFPFLTPSEPGDIDGDTGMLEQHLSQAHEPSLLVSIGSSGQNEGMGALPRYQASSYRSSFDFGLMENFAADEKRQLGIFSPPRTPAAVHLSFQPSTSSSARDPPQLVPDGDPVRTVITSPQEVFTPADAATANDTSDTSSTRLRHRKLSLSNTVRPRTRRLGGKMALFEGSSGAPPPSFGLNSASGAGRLSAMPSFENLPRAEGGGQSRLPPLMYNQPSHDRPYRFSFYSNSLSATIHSRSLSELPAEGQSFEDLFTGLGSRSMSDKDEPHVFSIHPLTTEDIQMEETREKIELFRNYYLVCFRSFDQDQYSPTYLEPLNMYIIVFREGTLSFHFRPTPHPQNVRRRIKQLKDYINVTSDWISYALIDDITDAFGPLIQNIEYEVDSIDELVLILKEAEQSDMLRRIGTCRKKVMGLLRLMGNKADVVKGLAKRCNENWSIAPKSDIISIEMTDANNQINDVLSKLTALGTVLIPMNLVTGLWGMNVHVPGQSSTGGYTWFVSIIGGLIGFALIGGFLTYKLVRR
ncbi:hypothetical protein EW145_g123 [Phellinidium pouzarii]|uniref:Cora-domain-containing protein n=1 Tax=Phellinidium pouzarii TaxID=167371 RepID=A0A4S4LJK2_9AGAM|nr:hypothetical protein EW145_g123 [Phellinidium pouzarii]